jgi:hypothetical protein
MTLRADRLEALVIARARSAGKASSLTDLVKPLARFAPAELTPAAWRDQLAEVVTALQGRDVLDARHQLRDPEELIRRLGRTTARTWPQLADRVLPALGLAVAADDSKTHAQLAGRDAWAAAIVGRALGLWTQGPPPSLAAACDALVWRELALPGAPKRCPPEVRAVFVQRQLHSDAGPPERLVRVLAAREVAAPRPELRVLCDALVRRWLAGRALGPASASSFGDDVRSAAAGSPDGRFGDRKVFVSAVWRELRKRPRWSALTLDELKHQLVAAHRAGELVLARADLVAAMDPALVAASEIATDGASFHFVIAEPAA